MQIDYVWIGHVLNIMTKTEVDIEVNSIQTKKINMLMLTKK